MAPGKPFIYHSRLWLLLSHIILCQTCSKPRKIAVKIVKLIIEKIHFSDLVKDTKSVAGFSASHQFRVGPKDNS